MNEKKCIKCFMINPINEFHKFKDMKDGYRNNCKVCQNNLSKLNKAKRGREYHNLKSKIYRETNRQRVISWYGGKLECNHCGLIDPCFSIYDFHHTNPEEKEERIGVLINKGWKKIEKELVKCIVLCANCHRRLHYEKNKETC